MKLALLFLILFFLAPLFIGCGRTNGSAPSEMDAAFYDANHLFAETVGMTKHQVEESIGANYELSVKLSKTVMVYKFLVPQDLRAKCLAAQKLTCEGPFLIVVLFLNQNGIITEYEVQR